MATISTFARANGKYDLIDQKEVADITESALALLAENDRIAIVSEGPVQLLTKANLDEVRANRSLPPAVLHRGEDVFLLVPKHKPDTTKFLADNGWGDLIEAKRPLAGYAGYRAFRADTPEDVASLSPKRPNEVDVYLPDGRVVGFDSFQIIRETGAASPQVNSLQDILALASQLVDLQAKLKA